MKLALFLILSLCFTSCASSKWRNGAERRDAVKIKRKVNIFERDVRNIPLFYVPLYISKF